MVPLPPGTRTKNKMKKKKRETTNGDKKREREITKGRRIKKEMNDEEAELNVSILIFL